MFPESITLDAHLEKSTPSEALRHVRSIAAEARLHLIKIAGGQWVIIIFVPDGTPVARRMMLSSSVESLKQQLGSSHFVRSDFVSDASELDDESLLTPPAKTAAGHSDMMLESEVLAMKEAKEESVATGQGGALLAVPLTADAQAAVKEMAAGARNHVVLQVPSGGGAIELDAKATSAASLLAGLPRAEARLSLVRVSNGASESAVLLAYTCPEAVGARQRMLTATICGTVPHAAALLGVAVKKQVQTEEIDSLTDAFLLEAAGLDGAAAASASSAAMLGGASAELEGKPKMAGRGGRRRLIRTAGAGDE